MSAISSNDASSCSAFLERNSTSWLYASKPTPFFNTDSIIRAHQRTPRFGHTSDIMVLLSGTSNNNDTASDYLNGILAASILIMVFIISWTTTLLVLKCLGYRRVGVFAGSLPPTKPPPIPPLLLASSSSSQQPEQQQANADNRQVVVESDQEKPTNCVKTTSLLEKRDSSPLEQQNVVGDDDSVKTETNVREHAVDDAIIEGAVKDMKESLVEEEEESTPASEDEHNNDNITNPASSKALDEWQAEVQASNLSLRRIRIAVLCAGIIIVVAAVLMVSKGISSLSSSLSETELGLQEAELLALEAVELIESIWRGQQESITTTTQLRQDALNLCNAELCVPNTTTLAAVCNSTNELWEALQEIEEQGRRYVFGELFEMRSDLLELADTFESLQRTANNFNWAFWISGAYALALGAC